MSWGGSVEDREEVVLAHDQVLLTIDLDLGAAVLREQHLVAGLHVERDDLAVLVALAGADRDDLAPHRLLLRGVGDEQTAGGLGLLIEALDQDAVVQRTDLHARISSSRGSWKWERADRCLVRQRSPFGPATHT